MNGTALVQAILAADGDAVQLELADDAAFNSPIRRYERRAEVVHLLALIGSVLPEARAERVWTGTRGAVTVISAALEDGRLDGVIEELHDADGRAREVTLMLRPYPVMMAAIKRMAAALERHPPPPATTQ